MRTRRGRRHEPGIGRDNRQFDTLEHQPVAGPGRPATRAGHRATYSSQKLAARTSPLSTVSP